MQNKKVKLLQVITLGTKDATALAFEQLPNLQGESSI
jgi:hypothetical protein